MTEVKDPLFACETCGREGDYSEFLDLNDDDWNDPFTIYTVCPQCYNVMHKNETIGSVLLLLYVIGIIFAGFEMKIQILLLITFYVLNLLRRILYFSFLKNKILKDNLKNPKEFLLLKLKEQCLLCLLTPLDLIISPIRAYIDLIKK